MESCIELIQKLGLHIVAEGVETEEQVKMLTEEGVTYLQGYFYSKPIPENAYLEFISK